MICPDDPTEIKRAPPCGEATAIQAAVTENGGAENDPFLLMSGSGLGRINTISSDESAPLAAHSHPPELATYAQKFCIVMPLLSLYVWTILSAAA